MIVAEWNWTWPDRAIATSDLKTVCKLKSTIPLLFYTNSTSWNFLALSILLITTPGTKKTWPKHSPRTTEPQDIFGQRNEDVVTPKKRTCKEGTKPKSTQNSPSTFSKVLVNGNGQGRLRWRWKAPSGFLSQPAYPWLHMLFFGSHLASCFS